MTFRPIFVKEAPRARGRVIIDAGQEGECKDLRAGREKTAASTRADAAPRDVGVSGDAGRFAPECVMACPNLDFGC